jgi:hypothetical protein
VWTALSRHVPAGQIRKIQDTLPKDMRAYWHALEEAVIPPPERGRSPIQHEDADDLDHIAARGGDSTGEPLRR